MASRVVLAGASVTGRDHSVVGKNNQDSFVIGQRDDAFWGIVADGCGEGARSETGAHLVTALAHRSLLNISTYRGMTSFECVSDLMSHIVQFQQNLISWFGVFAAEMPEAEKQFAFNHMLCTVVGFFVRGDEGYVFWAGDGAYQLGSVDPVVIDSDNKPKYLAYNALKSELPNYNFQAFTMSEVRRVAVSTDGFDPTLFDVAFDKQTPNALKRFLNVEKNHGKCSDDTTIVTAQLIEET